MLETRDQRSVPRRSEATIVLATYNGGPYLASQVESLQLQTEPNWDLLIRDDGSTDDTRAQVETFQRNDERVTLWADDAERLGPARSFGRLLREAHSRGARYVFCCDQDDLWQSDKLVRILTAFQQAERDWGPETPVLVHSDARLVDAAGNDVGTTFAKKVAPPAAADARMLPSFLLGNRIPGCTLAVNRPLLDLAIPQPDAVPMHDWWLALLAAAAGRVVWLPDSLVDYRQHGGNSVGAPGLWQRAWAALRTESGTGSQRGWRGIPNMATLLADRLRERDALSEIACVTTLVYAATRPTFRHRWRELQRWCRNEQALGARFARAERCKLWALAWSTPPAQETTPQP